ncbi:MAG: hypothetical protein L0220_06700, partial [Acidobacteria bacterium]|nr:hypothetical protein [Acidobacteriota bacterium]
IFIPGKLNASRDKLFFFAGQEYRRRIGDFITRATTPTSAERSGIINSTGQLRYPANFRIEALRGQPISDPSRGTPGNPQGLNIIPSQFIDPNGRAIMNIFQTMTGVAAQYADLPISNNTVFQLRQPSQQREDIIKIDYHFSPTHQFTYTNLYDDVEADVPTFLGSYPTYGRIAGRRGRTNQLAWTHVISPRTVNRVRLHLNHLNLFDASIDDFSRDVSRYGFNLKELFGNDIQTVGIPRFEIQGFSPINGAQLPGQPPTTDISIADDFSHVRGNHNLKMGFLGIRNRKNERIFETRSIVTGGISFSPAGNPNTTGNALADALLGNFQSWTESQRDITLKIRFTQLEGYLADTWKVRPNLSLDLGIRYS